MTLREKIEVMEAKETTMSKTISTIEELDAIILSLIKIQSYNRMLNEMSVAKKKKLLEICIDNNVKDSVDFVLMCEG